MALDGYHNNESEPHYRWEGSYPQLGALIDSFHVQRTTITTPLLRETLAGVDCLIIVDPDIPSEAADPKYISKEEAEAIAGWVKGGGVLLMLGNDPGNAEFEHLNALAARFGIEFLQETHKDASGSVKPTVAARASQHVFRPGAKFYGVGIAPLKVTDKHASILLEDNGQVLMAAVPHGRGRVLALGDPWLYDEYIHTQDNYQMAEDLFRWLLKR